MKKIITLFAIVGLLSLQSCTVNDTNDNNYVDSDTISEVFEVNRSFTSSNGYSTIISLDPAIYSSDVILVYRLSGTFNGNDVWKLLPETFYFDNGTLDFGYRFDFTKYDVNVYLVGNDKQSIAPEFTTNQILRVVIVPGSFSNLIDKENYNEVIGALNIKENQIQKIGF